MVRTSEVTLTTESAALGVTNTLVPRPTASSSFCSSSFENHGRLTLFKIRRSEIPIKTKLNTSVLWTDRRPLCDPIADSLLATPPIGPRACPPEGCARSDTAARGNFNCPLFSHPSVPLSVHPSGVSQAWGQAWVPRGLTREEDVGHCQEQGRQSGSPAR